MKKYILILLLLIAQSANAQYTYTQVIDSAINPIPNLGTSPWYGQIELGRVNIDTVRVIMVIAQVRTSVIEFNQGQLTWKKGYYVSSKNQYLDISKKPISNLYQVFSTFPWW